MMFPYIKYISLYIVIISGQVSRCAVNVSRLVAQGAFLVAPGTPGFKETSGNHVEYYRHKWRYSTTDATEIGPIKKVGRTCECMCFIFIHNSIINKIICYVYYQLYI